MKHWKRRSSAVFAIVLQVLVLLLPDPAVAMTMEQFLTSLDMIRSGCAPKFKLKTEDLDRLRVGDFNFPPSQDLMVNAAFILQAPVFESFILLVLHKVCVFDGGHCEQKGGVQRSQGAGPTSASGSPGNDGDVQEIRWSLSGYA